MKAIQINSHGDINVLNVVNIDEPDCSKDKIKIQIKSCAINHLDIWVRMGLPKFKTPLPLILGSDASGTIVDKGKNISRFNIGDDVVIQPGVFNKSCKKVMNKKENYSKSYGIIGETENGVQCEYVVLDPLNVYKKPKHLSFEEASSMQLVFMTAYQMIVSRGLLKKNETILIYGATSGIGNAAIQIAKGIGAKIISTVGSKTKINYAYEIGSDFVLLHTSNNLYPKIQDITNGKGVDFVFEHIGLETWNQSLRVLNKGGRIVTCGATTGSEVNINLAHLFMKQQTIMGSTMSDLRSFKNVMKNIQNKKYKPFIDKIYSFNEVKKAHLRIENRVHFGKVLLLP